MRNARARYVSSLCALASVSECCLVPRPQPPTILLVCPGGKERAPLLRAMVFTVGQGFDGGMGVR